MYIGMSSRSNCFHWGLNELKEFMFIKIAEFSFVTLTTLPKYL